MLIELIEACHRHVDMAGRDQDEKQEGRDHHVLSQVSQTAAVSSIQLEQKLIAVHSGKPTWKWTIYIVYSWFTDRNADF